MENYCLYFYIPTDEKTLVQYAKRHIENCIDFSTNGVRCPESTCSKIFFPDSGLLFLHILIHKELKFLCRHCSRAFKYDNQLADHLEEMHSKNYDRKNHANFSLNIMHLQEQKIRKMRLKPFTFVFPNISKYKDGASLFMVCQFPQTAQFINTKHEAKQALKTCIDSSLVEKKMQCKFLGNGNACGLEFETCRELLLHLTTHFGITAICIYCVTIFDIADEELVEAMSFHMENVHKRCGTCNCYFTNILGHHYEMVALLKPYIKPSPNIDLKCLLYLPNFAFHLRTMTKIDYQEARKVKHPCLYLASVLQTKVQSGFYAEEVDGHLRKCFANVVITYSSRLECTFAHCPFTYSTCREIFVHMLLKHATAVHYTYICNYCLETYAEKKHLRQHLNDYHEYIVCETCFLSFDRSMAFSVHQHQMGHLT